MPKSQRLLIEAYLDYLNNFLSVAGFASHYYGISERDAEKIINKGRILHQSQFGPII